MDGAGLDPGATKAAASLPSSAGQGRGETRKGSWRGIRAGGDPSPVTFTDKTGSTGQINFIYCQPNQRMVMRIQN